MSTLFGALLDDKDTTLTTTDLYWTIAKNKSHSVDWSIWIGKYI